MLTILGLLVSAVPARGLRLGLAQCHVLFALSAWDTYPFLFFFFGGGGGVLG